jgi:hypothetical protein
VQPFSNDLTSHEWYSFEDEEGTWLFDVSFLTSDWKCIWGAGCQGVLTEAAPELGEGCCSYGAHFVSEEERVRVAEFAATLTPDEWQMAGEIDVAATVVEDEDGNFVTALVDDACCFLNRPDAPQGAGCALHLAAVARGRRPIEVKPDVCWQLPLRLEFSEDSSGHQIHTLREWKRRDWGAGGEDFDWWCTESADAFVATRPVYSTLADEITEMIGAERYHRLRSYLDGRPRTRFVGHPAIRVRGA